MIILEKDCLYSLGNFIIILNEDDDLKIYTEANNIMIKPSSSSALYVSTFGTNQQETNLLKDRKEQP